MGKLSIKCFGVGDGAACADRNHSCYLYDFGDTTLLIDCGEPVSRHYKASGLSYEKIDRILLSHMHFDHVGGFFMLVQGMWLEKRINPLPVHLPAHGIDPVRNLLDAACLFQEVLSFPLDFQPWQNGQSLREKNILITPHNTTHLRGFEKSYADKYPDRYEAFSFLLEGHGLRIGHSADIGDPGDLDPLTDQPLDLLVVELAHFQPQDLFHYLSGKSIRKIAFTHLGRPYWEDMTSLKKLAASMLPNFDYCFVQDLEEIVIDTH